MDRDEIDDAIAVELLNNQTDDELSLEDAERQTTAGGCLSTATIIVLVVIVLAFSFLLISHNAGRFVPLLFFAAMNLSVAREWADS